MKNKKAPKKTQQDFWALKKAIQQFEQWANEIAEELNKAGYSDKYLTCALDAARRVSRNMPEGW